MIPFQPENFLEVEKWFAEELEPTSAAPTLNVAQAETFALSDSQSAQAVFVSTQDETFTLSDSQTGDIVSGTTSQANESFTLSDSQTGSVVTPVQNPTVSGADELPRKKRWDQREDLLESIRELSPTPAVAERVVRAVERSRMAKLAPIAGVAMQQPVLALPESLRTLVRQAIEQVEERENEELLLLL